MRLAPAVQALLLTLLLSLATGCSSDPPQSPAGAAASSSATATTKPPVSTRAGRTMQSLQASVAALGAVEVSGGTVGQAEIGQRRGTANLRTGDFEASVGLGHGTFLEMIRQSDLTWIRAPASYWVRLGYTRASAAAARGKWIVAPAESARYLLDAMDPGALIRSLLALDPRDAVSVAAVRRGALRGSRVLEFRLADATQRIYLTAGRRPRLLRMSSTRSRVTTTVDFVATPRTFHVRLPGADQVVQP
ncbi:MAG: hypothetical protein NTV23_17140 [Propionibacteriales bacterium]|nr:hypothetical protein [Propionibacteriales bacterium]